MSTSLAKNSIEAAESAAKIAQKTACVLVVRDVCKRQIHRSCSFRDVSYTLSKVE